MPTPVPLTTFNTGELSPYMRGRLDLEVYRNGCKEVTNFLPLTQGGVMARPGTKFIHDTTLTTGNVRLLEFAPNSEEAFTLLFSDQAIRIYKSGTSTPVKTLTSGDGVPWTDSQLRDIDYEYQVDTIYLTHPAHEPQVLKYLGDLDPDVFSIGSLLDETNFKAPPFQKEDVTGTELIVSDEKYFVKILSTNANEFDAAITAAAGNFNTNPWYVEVQIQNKWALYRIADTNFTPAAPADPVSGQASTTGIYAIPITSVVEDLEPAANLIHLSDSYPDSHPELGSSEYELRSDTLVFSFDLESAYMRFENSYPDVLGGFAGTGVTAEGTKWVQLNEYFGQEDFPTEYLTGSRATADFEVGQTYKILTANGFVFDNAAPAPSGSGAPVTRTGADWNNSFRYDTAGDTFVATNHFRVNAAGGASTVLANLSSNKTFDVMRCSAVLNVVSPTGAITFDDTAEVHTATMRSSKSFFYVSPGNTSGVRVDQYILAQYGDDWVTFKVDSITGIREATVTVLDVIPTKKNSSDFVNNGRTTVFRVSSWWASNYPYSVAIHEQRLVFGGSPEFPETVWFSKTTDNYDFRTIESNGEVLDTTGITYDLGGRAYNRIRSMTSGPTLIIATEGAEWQLRPNNFTEALSPTNIRLTQETYIGSTLQAIRAGSSVFFVERSGRFFREMQFDYQIDGFKSVDLNVLADHLFRTDPIQDFCYQSSPRSVFWFVTESGLLYALTYEKERDVYAWSRHRTYTGDTVLAAAVMRQTNSTPQDKLFVVVNRNDQYLVEEMTPDFRDPGTDNYKPYLWQLDSAVRLPSIEGGYLATAKTITSSLEEIQNTTALIRIPSHSYSNGDKVRLTGTGIDALDDRVVVVGDATTDTFVAYELDGTTPIDTRGISKVQVTGSGTLPSAGWVNIWTDPGGSTTTNAVGTYLGFLNNTGGTEYSVTPGVFNIYGGGYFPDVTLDGIPGSLYRITGEVKEGTGPVSGWGFLLADTSTNYMGAAFIGVAPNDTIPPAGSTWVPFILDLETYVPGGLPAANRLGVANMPVNGLSGETMLIRNLVLDKYVTTPGGGSDYIDVGSHNYQVGDVLEVYDKDPTSDPTAVKITEVTVQTTDTTQITVSGDDSISLVEVDYWLVLKDYQRVYTETGYATKVIDSISGLDHLEGYEASVIVDGAYVGDTTVASGAINIASAFGRYAEKYVLVGLKYTCTLVTMPGVFQDSQKGILYGQKSRVSKLGCYLYESIGFRYGQEGGYMQSVNFHDEAPIMDQSPYLFTGFKDDFTVDSTFDLAKEIRVEQAQPYPLTIISLIPEY